MKKYTRAPLPFVGQKRAMLKLVVPLLYESFYEDYCILQKSAPSRTMQGACVATLGLKF